jgi:hypothetical protein
MGSWASRPWISAEDLTANPLPYEGRGQEPAESGVPVSAFFRFHVWISDFSCRIHGHLGRVRASAHADRAETCPTTPSRRRERAVRRGLDGRWHVAGRSGGTLRRDAVCGMRLVRCGSRAGCRRIATRDENGCSYPIEATVAREAGGGKVDISGQIRSAPVKCGHEHEYSSGSEDLRVAAAARGYYLRNSGQPAACHLRKHCKRFVTLRQPRATRAR